ncbi:hypothetical protein COM45_10070 [Corynebacterium accolens]|uniref:Uncharacterized protein n=1 Tax=Corynebacterium accolens TaxID=38284 RepID=A0A2A4AIC2_9CORY|nr:hypothetical protein COM45_10070 [Corynebacterium accolens]
MPVQVTAGTSTEIADKVTQLREHFGEHAGTRSEGSVLVGGPDSQLADEESAAARMPGPIPAGSLGVFYSIHSSCAPSWYRPWSRSSARSSGGPHT